MDFSQFVLTTQFLGTPLYFWAAFAAVMVALLAFDLGIFSGGPKEIGTRESFKRYCGYLAITALFGGWIWWAQSERAGLEFFTAYVIEQSLAMDNVFVIASIFAFLGIPRLYQHRVLFWGILGVIIFRAILIGFGVALVTSFSWILVVFGLFLVFTGLNIFRSQGHSHDNTTQKALPWLQARFPVTEKLHGEKFLVFLPDARSGQMKRHLTPLLVALLIVELVDLVFAVDSVPAVFAVTQDPFIIYTSNIFAVLGLRSLYFALAAAVNRFKYLQTALATILTLVGIKIFLVPLGIKIDVAISLVAMVAILTAGIFYSLWATRNESHEKT
jgi:tellurite resistance protein TerC